MMKRVRNFPPREHVPEEEEEEEKNSKHDDEMFDWNRKKTMESKILSGMMVQRLINTCNIEERLIRLDNN